MKSSMLFPHKYKFVGLFLAIIGIVGVWLTFLKEDAMQWSFLEIRSGSLSDEINMTDEIFFVMAILGLLFMSFSKEKKEDERICQIRLESLQWTIYFHYILLIASIVFIHGLLFLYVLILNIFLPLIFFLIRFRWIIFQENRLLKKDEK
jgi:hypothetical protein